MPTSSYSGCKKGTFTAYLERNNNVPRGYSTARASRYILNNPHKFQTKTIRRARLFINTGKGRKRGRR